MSYIEWAGKLEQELLERDFDEARNKRLRKEIKRYRSIYDSEGSPPFTVSVQMTTDDFLHRMENIRPKRVVKIPAPYTFTSEAKAKYQNLGITLVGKQKEQQAS